MRRREGGRREGGRREGGRKEGGRERGRGEWLPAAPASGASETGGLSQSLLLLVYVNPTNGRWTVSAVTLFSA